MDIGKCCHSSQLTRLCLSVADNSNLLISDSSTMALQAAVMYHVVACSSSSADPALLCNPGTILKTTLAAVNALTHWSTYMWVKGRKMNQWAKGTVCGIRKRELYPTHKNVICLNRLGSGFS